MFIPVVPDMSLRPCILLQKWGSIWLLRWLRPEGRRGCLFTGFSTTKFSVIIIGISIDVLREGKEPPSVIIFTIFCWGGYLHKFKMREMNTRSMPVAFASDQHTFDLPHRSTQIALAIECHVGTHVSNPTMGQTSLIRICIDRSHEEKPRLLFKHSTY